MKRARRIKGEGWAVFDTDGSRDGARQICVVDEPADGEKSLALAFGSKGGDDVAIKHVIRRAKRGDNEAIDALWEVLDEDGLVNRILWAQAMGWTGYGAYAYEEVA